MSWTYNDGGRELAGYKGTTGDCVCRAIAIATGMPYQQVYTELNKISKTERRGKRKRGKSSARTGVYKNTIKRYMESIGWKWVGTMGIGTGCKVHLHKDELPSGRLVVRLSKHITCMIDGVINDTFNPQRGGSVGMKNGKPFKQAETRCVYGYWIQTKNQD